MLRERKEYQNLAVRGDYKGIYLVDKGLHTGRTHLPDRVNLTGDGECNFLRDVVNFLRMKKNRRLGLDDLKVGEGPLSEVKGGM